MVRFTLRTFLFSVIIFLTNIDAKCQIPQPALVGYLHNWNYSKAPYIEPVLIDDRYNVIEIAFAVPKSGTTYDMKFKPSKLSKNEFIRQIQTVQQKGKKVLISLGGGGQKLQLNTYQQKEIFINSVNSILNDYGFDGIDLDLEAGSVSITGGTIKEPVDSAVIYVIEAVKSIMKTYRQNYGRKLLLTMAPETAYVQGGQSNYKGVWGAHLPIIDALRDSIDILQTQLYNSGSMYGIDRNIYIQGTADFIVAMCEAVIHGFPTKGGHFEGLPANKIAIGLPACPDAAGHGYTLPVHVRNAANYLMGKGVQPGLYKLAKQDGYPDLLGMMTWSVNWDAVSSCASSYEYAQTFEDIFGTSGIRKNDSTLPLYPNPASNYIYISLPADAVNGVKVYNVFGTSVLTQISASGTGRQRIDVSGLPPGVYFIRAGEKMYKFIKI
jgi:chitinase